MAYELFYTFTQHRVLQYSPMTTSTITELVLADNTATDYGVKTIHATSLRNQLLARELISILETFDTDIGATFLDVQFAYGLPDFRKLFADNDLNILNYIDPGDTYNFVYDPLTNPLSSTTIEGLLPCI